MSLWSSLGWGGLSGLSGNRLVWEKMRVSSALLETLVFIMGPNPVVWFQL